VHDLYGAYRRGLLSENEYMSKLRELHSTARACTRVLPENSRCGAPAVERARLPITGLTIYICGPKCKVAYTTLLRDLEWRPVHT
jgi:hypothetical protein